MWSPGQLMSARTRGAGRKVMTPPSSAVLSAFLPMGIATLPRSEREGRLVELRAESLAGRQSREQLAVTPLVVAAVQRQRQVGEVAVDGSGVERAGGRDHPGGRLQ